ncbi:MAG: polyribonucleotide nucleotidyltransferase [Bacilli bacterium]|nr:polyribonucleotide nucleotidyltransferase [Bacilli bacterium]MDD4795222.1 polyribonucleotide nucleotidyltransferase [Bacilli bacterium]
MKKEFNFDFLGRNITVEIGEVAKQADGSVVVRYEDTVVLTAAVMNNNVATTDFFPLQVMYNEKLYSAGKIPGGFIKREGRPSDNATLTARLIDRPIRPMFADNFRNEVQVINTVLSVDPDHSPEMSALFASSLALGISEIPFDGPVAGVIVGKIGKDYIINPTSEELEQSQMSVTVAGTKDDICMIEAGAKEVSEADMLEALLFGQKYIKQLCEFQEEIIKVVGKEKVEVKLAEVPADLEKEVIKYAEPNMLEAVQIKNKLESYTAIDKVKEETTEYFTNLYSDDDTVAKNVKTVVNNIEAKVVRDLITNKKIRPDGRKLDEIRDLSALIDFLPRTHGSALFTRGQTQALATTTLGAIGEHQILDGLGIEDSKRFMLHYNFPQFSVGETGRYGAPGRREIGHGALGEKALLQVIPSEEEFPYTIRVVSEILESNGSSSQASICAGCLSLMAAGVPIKAPVAGIAMGLITKGKKYSILTDIAGIEDHMGDMDFKVAGTKDGITALQMDIKIKGVTKNILKEALADAKKARLKILKVMTDVIPAPRAELSKYAPKIKMITIDPEKIKDVIGRGGEMITKIILEASGVSSVNDKEAVKVDLEDDGRVIVYHTDYEIIDKTIKMIENIVKEVVPGEIYEAVVVKVEDFGCFVKLWEGCEGLVHVSQLAHERVNKPSDIVKVGDTIMVKAQGYDNRGRLNLSRKEALPKPKAKEENSKKSE